MDAVGRRYDVRAGCPLRCQYCEKADTWTMCDGRRVTMGRMMDEIAKYPAFLTTAHGGITVSGGEPMLQIRFLEALLLRCKQDLGLHTAVDTSGFLGERASGGFLDLVDLFLLRFARRLSDRGNRTWVRFVLNGVERVEVPSFYQLGAGRWAELGLAYQLTDVLPPSPELVRHVEEQFRPHGLNVV